METTVVKEYTAGGKHFQEMSDGRILVSPMEIAPGTEYGTYVKIKGEVTDEKLAKAKEMVVEDVCRIIRDIANEREDFFIIRELMDGDGTSVAHKFFLPTVNEDGFERFKENPVIE